MQSAPSSRPVNICAASLLNIAVCTAEDGHCAICRRCAQAGDHIGCATRPGALMRCRPPVSVGCSTCSARRSCERKPRDCGRVGFNRRHRARVTCVSQLPPTTEEQLSPLLLLLWLSGSWVTLSNAPTSSGTSDGCSAASKATGAWS